MKYGQSSPRLPQDVLAQGDKIFAEAVNAAGTGAADPDAKMRLNELLLKIDDHTLDVNRALRDIDLLQKQLKTQLDKLNKFKKILTK